MTKRGLISKALEVAFKTITKDNGYNTNLYENVKPRFIFPEDDPELPLISFSMGTETITYQPGGPQDRFLSANIRLYIEDENDPVSMLEDFIQDVEKVVETNSRLLLEDNTRVRDIKVTLIETDQGVLAPLGLAEIQLVIEY